LSCFCVDPVAQWFFSLCTIFLVLLTTQHIVLFGSTPCPFSDVNVALTCPWLAWAMAWLQQSEASSEID